MPYGIDKSIGGDSPENIRRIKSCVTSVMRDNPGYSKARAISICKAQLKKSKGASLTVREKELLASL